MKMIRALCRQLCCCLLLAASAQAQTNTGTLTGRVVGPGGVPAVGTEVTVGNPKSGLDVRQASTGAEGRYVVEVAEGEYSVAVRAPGGAASRVVGRVRVDAQQRTRFDITLHEFDLPIDRGRTRSEMGGVSSVGALEFEELPLLSRNYTELIALLPGVSSDLPDEVPFGARGPLYLSIAGGRASAVTWLLDQVSTAHPGNLNGVVMTPSLDTIGGADLQSGAFEASRRGGGGGIVGVVSRSGTQRFTGTAQAFVRNDALRSGELDRVIGPDGVGFQKADPRLRSSHAGFTLGGPALPGGRPLYFFLAEEWRHRSGEHARLSGAVPDPSWLTDPASPNYVPPDERDPNAVKLLEAWPAPNVPGTNLYEATFAVHDDARQDALRLDYAGQSGLRLTGRYLRDGGTEFSPSGYPPQARGDALAVPNFNTGTDVDRVGHVMGVEASFASGRFLSAVSYSLADHRLTTSPREGLELRRDAFGIDIPELFPSNTGNRIPSIFIEGLTATWSPQPPDLLYRAHEFAGEAIVERGTHTVKTGMLVDVEEDTEDENCQAAPGVFYFGSTTDATSFQNFLRGNRDQTCGGRCFYNEDVVEPKNHYTFGRYDFFVQDTWRATDRLTLDMGLRYSLLPPIKDDFNRLFAFAPAAFDESQAPAFGDPWGFTLQPGTGNQINGFYVAGRSSPYGDAVYAWDTNNIQPRFAVSWRPTDDDGTVVRAAVGVYFDRVPPRVFTAGYLNPIFPQQVSVINPVLSDPSRGSLAEDGVWVADQQAVAAPLVAPRTDRWSLGVTRRLYARGTIDVGYEGARGVHQVRPVDINQPQPGDINPEEPWVVNPVRPYQGYGSLVVFETTGRSRYDGLLAGFRHRGGRAGSLAINYTWSNSRADASEAPGCPCQFDRPQNPQDKNADFPDARTDRRHVFNASYVMELPFFRDDPRAWVRHVLGGWQVAGITRISSGPAARVLYQDDLGIRRTNLVGDPGAGSQPGYRWVDPSAFAPPAAGTYGTAPVTPFRLPGQHRWDLTVSKNFYPTSTARLQLRADIINLFNRTQYDSIVPYCFESGCDFVGEVVTFRAPREVQLGVKLFW